MEPALHIVKCIIQSNQAAAGQKQKQKHTACSDL